MKSISAVGYGLLALGLTACSKQPVEPSPDSSSSAAAVAPAPATASGTVTLAATQGNTTAGAININVVDGVVTLTGQVSGLQADSEHGFHVHEKGDCSAPDGSSAGGHFNPAGAAHGAPSAEMHHVGDILNIKADASGVAPVDVKLAGATFRDGGTNDIAGKAIIVHAQPDDYTTQPSGNAGGRIACGVIQ